MTKPERTSDLSKQGITIRELQVLVILIDREIERQTEFPCSLTKDNLKLLMGKLEDVIHFNRESKKATEP